MPSSAIRLKPLVRAPGSIRPALMAAALMIVVALCSQSGRAAECDGSQADLTACAGAAARTSDAALNAVYRQVAARLGRAGRARLRLAERAWIDYRVKQCAFISNGDEGGSAAPMVARACMAAEADARASVLQKLVVCTEGDLSCPR